MSSFVPIHRRVMSANLTILIEMIRKERKISMEELSGAIGISRKTYSKHVNRKAGFTDLEIRGACEYLKLSVIVYNEKGKIY